MLNQGTIVGLITCLVSIVSVQLSAGPVEDKYSCPHGWTRYGSKKCLKYVNELQDYERAQATCRLKNQGTLVTVHSAEEQNFVYSYIHSIAASSTPIWLGAKQQIDFESILWLDKTENSYTNWAPSEPSHPDEICIAINPRNGQWQDVMCTEAFVPACERAPTTQWPFFVAFCSEGWFQYNDEKCVRIISSQALNFYESQELCRSKYNSKLLSIKADKESEFVHNLIKFRDVKVPVWLGAVQNDFSSFNWIDKSDVTFTNWAEGEPNDPDHACISMVASGGKWSDNDCKEQKLILCQKVPEEGACETGWLQFRQDKCYRFVHIRLALDDAESLCSNLYGGHLPSIHSQEEQFMITQFLASVNVKNGSEIWLGGRQMDFHNFNWGDGSPFNYSYWEHGEPSFPAEKCIEMSWRNGRWNDINCRLKRAVLCERQVASRHAINKPIHYQPTTCLDSNCTTGSTGIIGSQSVGSAPVGQQSPTSDLSVASAGAEPRGADHLANSDNGPNNANASSAPDQILIPEDKPIKVIASIMNLEQQHFMAPSNEVDLHHAAPNATSALHPPHESNATSIHYNPSPSEPMLSLADAARQASQNSSSQNTSSKREPSQTAGPDISDKDRNPVTMAYASQDGVNQLTVVQQEENATVSLLDKIKTQTVTATITTPCSVTNQSSVVHNPNTTALDAPKSAPLQVVVAKVTGSEKPTSSANELQTTAPASHDIDSKQAILVVPNSGPAQEIPQVSSSTTTLGQQRERINPTDSQSFTQDVASS